MTKIKKELKEKLANIEHQRWADWQKWCHKVLRENCPSPELEKVLERWDKQIATDYKDLTEKEKDSDREQVERYWPLIEKALQAKEEEVVGRIETEMKEWRGGGGRCVWPKYIVGLPPKTAKERFAHKVVDDTLDDVLIYLNSLKQGEKTK